jgi:sialidase-1
MDTSRRRFIRHAAIATAAPFFVGRSAKAAPVIRIHDTKVISQQPEFYCGWPTVALRKNGTLWVTWSGGREAHVCPFGQVHAMTSSDHGESWTWPRVLHDSAIDDRDSGCLETAKGSLLVSTFSSLAYEPYLEKQIHFDELSAAKGWKTAPMKPEQLARWKAAHARLGEAERKAELGEWLLRSTDGGLSWSTRIRTIVNSPHGPVQLSDGRLLYAGKQLWAADKKTAVCESKDDGLTWQWLAEIPARQGDANSQYHELHAVEAKDGTLIVQIRNHNKTNAGWTLQTESRDGGKTWGEPHPVCYGLPSHLLRLRDGRLLMSYGHRRAPFGNQARLSEDNGRTWSGEMIISGDGPGGDLGYPSTVELADGSLLTVWYESMKEHPKAVLRQARWTLA